MQIAIKTTPRPGTLLAAALTALLALAALPALAEDGRFAVFGNSPEREAYFAGQAADLEARRLAEADMRARLEAEARADTAAAERSRNQRIIAGTPTRVPATNYVGVPGTNHVGTTTRTSPVRRCDRLPYSDAPFRSARPAQRCVIVVTPTPVIVVPVTPTPRPGVTVTLGPNGLATTGRITGRGLDFRFNSN